MNPAVFAFICALLFLGCEAEPEVRINFFSITHDADGDGITSPGDRLTLTWEVVVIANDAKGQFVPDWSCDVTLDGDLQGLNPSQTRWRFDNSDSQFVSDTLNVTIPPFAPSGATYDLTLTAKLSTGAVSVSRLVITALPKESDIRLVRFYISGGDSDGRLTPGEKNVRLQLALLNAGQAPVGRLTCRVSAVDSTVAVMRGAPTLVYDDIAPQDTADWRYVVFDYDSSAPVYDPALFALAINDENDRLWLDTVRVFGSKGPKAEISAWKLFDTSGNMDGIANPGEVIQLSFEVQDTGGWMTVTNLNVTSIDDKIQWNTNHVYPIPELYETNVFTTAPADVSLLILASHPSEPIPLCVTIRDEFDNRWVTELSVPVVR